jgi:hypothetical protein
MKASLYHLPARALPAAQTIEEQSIPTILGRLAVEVAVYGGLAAAILAVVGTIA